MSLTKSTKNLLIGKDRAVRNILALISLLTVLVIILIIAFIGMRGLEVFSSVSFVEFIFGTEWDPSNGYYGAFAIILGSLLVTLGAVAFATPIGLGAAIYISEFASPNVRTKLKPICEVFAGIPSVVYGFFGLLALLPVLLDLFPGKLTYGTSWFASSILLGIMALPTIISVSEDAIHAVPRSYREASMGMGATRWQTAYKVVLPAAISGISAAVTLGIGRAIGETMAVMMISGNTPIVPDPIWNMFSLISTITGILALEMPEITVGSTHYSALFMLALVLMIIILFINLVSRYIIRRTRRKYYGDERKNAKVPFQVDDHIQKYKSMLLRVCLLVFLFVLVAPLVSLFLGSDLLGLVAGVGTVAAVIVLPKLLDKVNSNVRQEVAVTCLTVNMILVLAMLVAIIGYILVKGVPHLSVEFLTTFPTEGGKGGGILPAIVGTLQLLFGTALLALPFGVLTGIYLAEYAGDTRMTRIIREAIDILNGTPSIVFGLFCLTFFVLSMGFGYSLIAGCLALAFMIVPVIIRTTEEALHTVPNELREASRALGATKWQTIYKVVLPAAMGGTVTGAILALGRAAGETAPIMFTAAVAFQPSLTFSLLEPVMALPYHLYYLAAEAPMATGAQFGTATVLLFLVLGMFLLASIVRNHYSKKIKW